MVNYTKYNPLFIFYTIKMILTADEEIKDVLKNSNTIAVVGCSREEHKAAHIIPKHMQSVGYNILPINPFSDRILGKKTYNTIDEVSEEIDILNIFRPSSEALEIVKRSIQKKPKCIWMQLGIENKEAAELASEHGILIVMNRCIGVEYDRLMT